MADVVVIGAGITGAAAAYELATAGLGVVLLDRYGPAAMASGWTLGGVRQSGRHPAELQLARAAVARWSELDQLLGGPTGYHRGGNLRLARTEAECAVIRTLVQAQTEQGLDLEFIQDRQILRELAPALSDDVLAASICPTDGAADSVASVNAYVSAATRAGAVIRFGERAIAIETAAGRVTAVRTGRGRIAAGAVILAAGIFGNELLTPLGLHVPLRVPMVTVLRSAPMPVTLRQVIGVANADCAGRQQPDGRFRVTSGLENWDGVMQETDRPVVHPTAGSVAETVERFGHVVPAFRSARIETLWAGLIDLTPDALPVIDSVPEPAGLTIAMGFSGHGFCLGPITGRILAELAQRHAPTLPIAPFQLARFAGAPATHAHATLHG